MNRLINLNRRLARISSIKSAQMHPVWRAAGRFVPGGQLAPLVALRLRRFTQPNGFLLLDRGS
jgi:hypothetical protein